MKTMVEVPDGLFRELWAYFPLQRCNGDLVIVAERRIIDPGSPL
jgi:hypothetical protein